MEVCSICLENLKDNDIILSCKHIFHLECLIKLKQFKCPLCRKKFNIRKLLNLSESDIVCFEDSINHFNCGYSPYIKDGNCRFCNGKKLEYYFNNLDKN